MGLDLGSALLQKDYNEELREAQKHYAKKGKQQGLWGNILGTGLQLGTSMFLSPATTPLMMALYGGGANALGTYLGGLLGSANVGDYNAKFGQETIGELGSALDDSLLTSALESGVKSGALSYQAGLGAGDLDTVGKVTDEAIETGLDKAASEQLVNLEHGVFKGDPARWHEPTFFQTDAAGVKSGITDTELLKTLKEGGTLGPEYKDYSFTAEMHVPHKDAISLDYNWYKDLMQAKSNDYALGTQGMGGEVQAMLRAKDLENLGLDPMAQMGIDPITNQPILLQDSLQGMHKEDLMSYYRDTQKELTRATLEPELRKQAALRGMDAEGNFLVEDPADLGTESFGKRWQDMRTLGWDESGGMSGLWGDAGLHFEKQPDIMTWDPDMNDGVGGFVMTPAPNQNIGIPNWIKNNPMMALGGGAGLLWTLLNQE